MKRARTALTLLTAAIFGTSLLSPALAEMSFKVVNETDETIWVRVRSASGSVMETEEVAASGSCSYSLEKSEVDVGSITRQFRVRVDSSKSSFSTTGQLIGSGEVKFFKGYDDDRGSTRAWMEWSTITDTEDDDYRVDNWKSKSDRNTKVLRVRSN